MWESFFGMCFFIRNRFKMPPGFISKCVRSITCVCLFLYRLSALGSISMVVFTVLIKLKMDY